jgi:N-acetylmuramoyl-L-alanine amidase
LIGLSKIIWIDAGHGGSDPGALGFNIKEKDLTLDIALLIQKGLNEYDDVDVRMSRTTDVYLSLQERTKMANHANADIFVSIHINAAMNKAAKGFESYTYPGSNAGTRALQNVLHREVYKMMGNVDNRGMKQKNLHVLRESKMKAILTESLFISNPEDNKLLQQEEYIQKIAQGHINGLESFLGLKKTSKPPPIVTKHWHVQVGAFEEKENAEAMVNDLKRLGYRPIVKYE